MKMLWRMGLVALAVVLVYWFTVPFDRVSLRADVWETPLVDRVWHSRPQGLLMVLSRASVTRRLQGLPVSDVSIAREQPWNATIEVSVLDPDVVIRQGDRLAVVFLQTETAYMVSDVLKSWTVVPVSGFPTAAPAFLSAVVKYAPLCCQLMEQREQLAITRMSFSSSTGLSAHTKDSKTLVFGDTANAASKIERAIAVLSMPAFKGRKVTVDLRFDGQAVIPGTP